MIRLVGAPEWKSFQFSQGEGISSEGDAFAGAEAGHADAEALKGVVSDGSGAAGNLDGFPFALEESFDLGRILQFESG